MVTCYSLFSRYFYSLNEDMFLYSFEKQISIFQTEAILFKLTVACCYDTTKDYNDNHRSNDYLYVCFDSFNRINIIKK